jgi:hypothetical protein
MKPLLVLTFKRILGLALLGGLMFLLLTVPTIYWARTTSLPEDVKVDCRAQTESDHEATTVKEAVLDYAVRSVKVKMDGWVSWSPAAGAFYLRDGVYGIRLDDGGCVNADVLKDGRERLVFVKGVTVIEDGEPVLRIDGIHPGLPLWAQIAYNAGVWFFLVLLIIVGAWFFKLLGWLLVVIGSRQPKPNTPERIAAGKNARAGSSIQIAVLAPLVWYFNPIIGVAYSGLGIYRGWQGLKSSKRTVAIIGLILCGAGLIAIPIFFASRGFFSRIVPNIAQSDIIDHFESATNTMP